MQMFSKVAKRMARSKRPFAVVVVKDGGSRYFDVGGVCSQHASEWEAQKSILLTGYQNYMDVVDSRVYIERQQWSNTPGQSKNKKSARYIHRM